MLKKKGIPFIGLVSKEGYIESYDYSTAEKHDFHHSFVLSKRGERLYHRDDTLRFVMYVGSGEYTLEGFPSLDPFSTGERQMKLFARHVIEHGAPPTIPVVVAEQYMETEWEGNQIGILSDWQI